MQLAEVALSYQKVDFTHVAYDSAFRLWTEATLEFLTILELEEFELPAGEISVDHP